MRSSSLLRIYFTFFSCFLSVGFLPIYFAGLVRRFWIEMLTHFNTGKHVELDLEM